MIFSAAKDFAIVAYLPSLIAAAQDAGALAMRWFQLGAPTRARVDHKEGGSPVTEADFAVEALLEPRLRRAFPQLGWLSEEAPDNVARLTQREIIVLDPIDGTRAFARGDAHWAVALAIVRDGAPIAGVVHAPALNETFSAEVGSGAFLNGRKLDLSGGAPMARRVAGPEALAARMAEALTCEAAPKTPSLALRFASVAKGSWTGAIAKKNARDWDIAAADIILREAGGRIFDLEGNAPIYNTPHAAHAALCAARPDFSSDLRMAARGVLL